MKRITVSAAFVLMFAVLAGGCGRRTGQILAGEEPVIIGAAFPPGEVLSLYEDSPDSDKSLTGGGTGSEASEDEVTPDGMPGTEIEAPLLAVFVCGAVKSPGVYYFRDGERACDAVEEAGGFLEDADREYANLAEKLYDGQCLRICTEEEASALRAGTVRGIGTDTGSSISSGGGKINLNTAGEQELMTLPGIGASRARDIIEYRESHGGFGSVEEIKQVSGIKNSIFSKICDCITV